MAQKEPIIIRDKTQMRNWSRTMRSQSKLIALVPTMGYLHQGHLSLITQAHKHANLIVVSIYVNPGQFSPNEDLSTYPSDFQGDLKKLINVPGGLATSSRNVHLSLEEREKALSISKSLTTAKSAAEDGQVDCEKLRNLVIQCITEAGGRIDYAEIVDQQSLEKVKFIKGPVVFCIAAFFGKVRLIDNMEINL
uniref:Pantoate--beta-alanine ligase n=1 Tax=Medicago truncatula TaxID=3880 RepID=I3SLU9_MEDTR|nr:unknown [Medicago truncatula]